MADRKPFLLRIFRPALKRFQQLAIDAQQKWLAVGHGWSTDYW